MTPVNIERSISLSRELPRSKRTPAERAAFWQDVALVEHEDYLVQHPFIARLPFIIGEVPLDQRKAYDAFHMDGRRDTDVMHLREHLPSMADAVAEDIAWLGLRSPFTVSATAETTHEGGSSYEGKTRPWHLDAQHFYTIVNVFSTEFYQGQVQVKEHLYGRLDLLDGESVTTAPPYSIIRMSPLTVHRSPEFPGVAHRNHVVLIPRSR